VLFTRDLRMRDSPALAAACEQADFVVPLFVVDAKLMSAPNRARFVLECLADLRAELRSRGGDLVVRSGRPEAEAIRLATQTGTQTVFIAGDVSRYAARRPPVEAAEEVLETHAVRRIAVDVRRNELEAELAHLGEARRDPMEVFAYLGRAGHAPAVLATPADRLDSRPQREPWPRAASCRAGGRHRLSQGHIPLVQIVGVCRGLQRVHRAGRRV
jgi:DNA photolyase